MGDEKGDREANVGFGQPLGLYPLRVTGWCLRLVWGNAGSQSWVSAVNPSVSTK